MPVASHNPRTLSPSTSNRKPLPILTITTTTKTKTNKQKGRLCPHTHRVQTHATGFTCNGPHLHFHLDLSTSLSSDSMTSFPGHAASELLQALEVVARAADTLILHSACATGSMLAGSLTGSRWVSDGAEKQQRQVLRLHCITEFVVCLQAAATANVNVYVRKL